MTTDATTLPHSRPSSPILAVAARPTIPLAGFALLGAGVVLSQEIATAFSGLVVNLYIVAASTIFLPSQML